MHHPPRRDRFTALLLLGVLLVLAALAVTGTKSVRQLVAARQRERDLSAAIADAVARVGRLEEEIELLASDPPTLERRAREELGMVRPDELVVLFPRRVAPSRRPETEVVSSPAPSG